MSLVDGSFDPLHPGHLAYFRAARSLGYPLLCNICPDSETAQKHPVLLPADQRAQILDSLDILTYVHVSERPTVEILQQLRPAYYVKGQDWLNRLPVEQGQVCDELNVRIRFTDSVLASSSGLLAKFQPDVDAFERLVHGQQPAGEPWTPVLPYTIEARREVEGRQPSLIKEVFEPRLVMDYGCGAGYLVAFLAELGVNVYGYERSEALRDLCPPYVSHLVKDSCWHNELNSGPAYDLVICREVLEHCTILEIREIVHRLCRLSKRYCYVTTRFAKQPAHFLSVDTADNLDPDHRTMLHQDFLRTLFILEGFTRRADLEQRMDWQQKGRVLVYERG